MSEQQQGGAAAPEEPAAVVLPPQGDAAFSTLMDTLVADEAGAEADQGGGQVAAPDGAAAAAPADPAAAGAGGDAGAGGTPTAGDPAAPGAAPAGGEGAPAGDPQQPAAGAGGGDRPETWTAASADLIPKLGQLSTTIEENTTKAYQQAALEEVKTEHVQYFEALQKHPRLLVGTQVPAIGKEGMETLKDTSDAREWQEAVKSILVAEVNDKAGRKLEESSDFLETVHQSIELFQNNADLIPGTKDFDIELANRFASLAEPYELRVEGKLQGYSIPVQPIIEQLRAQLTADRAAKTAPAQAPVAAGAPVAGASTSTPGAPAAAPAEQPQAGIQSKAGSGEQADDFSTLFGTLGLPDLRI